MSANREGRDELERVTGQRGIPALVLDEGASMTETEAILEHLDTLASETEDSARHRLKAEEHA